MIQTLLEAFSVPLDEEVQASYRDLRAFHPHARAITTATRLGIISGDNDRNGHALGLVRPDDPVNRAEAAKIVSEMLLVD